MGPRLARVALSYEHLAPRRQHKRGTSLRRHADRAIQTDDLAIEHLILNDVLPVLVRSRPERENGTYAASDKRAGSGTAAGNGVSKIPGPIVITQIP